MTEKVKTRIYTPASSVAHPVQLISDMCADLVAGRGLAWQFAVRDIKSQYREAFLGVLWALILPLANTLTWVFLTRAGIVSVSTTGLPYAVYVFTGTMLWSVFMDALNAPLAQTKGAQSMLAKVNFPREALIMSGVLQTLFNAGIKISLLLSALIAVGIYPGWRLVLFPFALLSLTLAGTTLGLLVTPLGVLYSDVGKAISLVLQLLMFVTPVLFPVPATGMGHRIFICNPLTPLILTSRNWLTGFAADYLGQFLIINLLLCMLFLGAGVVYRLVMPILIERMGS